MFSFSYVRVTECNIGQRSTLSECRHNFCPEIVYSLGEKKELNILPPKMDVTRCANKLQGRVNLQEANGSLNSRATQHRGFFQKLNFGI